MNAYKRCRLAVVQVSTVENVSASEIYCWMQNLHDSEYMSCRSVFRWCWDFRSERRLHALDQIMICRQHCFFHNENPNIIGMPICLTCTPFKTLFAFDNRFHEHSHSLLLNNARPCVGTIWRHRCLLTSFTQSHTHLAGSEDIACISSILRPP